MNQQTQGPEDIMEYLESHKDEMDASAQAEYNRIAANYDNLLRAAAEAEETAQKAVDIWRERLLDIFTGDPGETHSILTEGNPAPSAADATPDNFTLGATPLGFSAVSWYRQANEDFQACKYADALSVLIDSETVQRIRENIETAVDNFQSTHSEKMTLSDFLSREYSANSFLELLPNPEDPTPLEIEEATKKYNALIDSGEIKPSPSIFDNILAQLDTEPGRAPNAIRSIKLLDKATQKMTEWDTTGKGNQLRVDPVKNRYRVANPVHIYINFDLSDTREKYPQLATQLEKMTEFDVAAYCAFCSLWRAWEEAGKPGGPVCVIYANQVFEAMRWNHRPNGRDYENLTAATLKFGNDFYIDNHEEDDAGYTKSTKKRKGYGLYDRKHRKLMHIDSDEKIDPKTGKPRASKFYLYSEPFLLEFAQSRNQLTAVNINPANKFPLATTEKNLKLDRYLISKYFAPVRHRKATRKMKKAQGVITLSTVYKEFNANSTKQRERIRSDLKDLLNYYIDNGDIMDCYTKGPDDDNPERQRKRPPKEFLFWL